MVLKNGGNSLNLSKGQDFWLMAISFNYPEVSGHMECTWAGTCREQEVLGGYTNHSDACPLRNDHPSFRCGLRKFHVGGLRPQAQIL